MSSQRQLSFFGALKVALIFSTYIVALVTSLIGALVLCGMGHYVWSTIAAWAFLVLLFFAAATHDPDEEDKE